MIEKRTKNGWFLDEICGQMYKTITLYAICGVEICEWRDFYVAHGNFLSTEHTDTHGFFPKSEVFKRILVKDFIGELVAYGKKSWRKSLKKSMAYGQKSIFLVLILSP